MRRQVLANEGKYLKETFSRKIWKTFRKITICLRKFEMKSQMSDNVMKENILQKHFQEGLKIYLFIFSFLSFLPCLSSLS